MKEFIYSSCLSSFRFYGTEYRLDLIFVDGHSFAWIVTCRTCSHRDEFTSQFADAQSAFDCYFRYVKKHL